MGSVIASHNRRIIHPIFNNHGCNFRNRAECQLNNKCLTANNVYEAVVSTPRNIPVMQKLHLKIVSEITQDIFVTKSILTF